MSDEIEELKSYTFSPSMFGLRTLTFADGTQTGIVGLDVIMQDLYSQGKQADMATAFEIMERLEYENNLEELDQTQCEGIFLEEYKRFLEMKIISKRREKNSMATNQNTRKKGLFNLLKGNQKQGGCCDMKIVPKEQSKGGCCDFKIVPKEQGDENRNCCK